MSLERFVEKWTHPEYPPEPVSEEDLRAAEQRLGRIPAGGLSTRGATDGLPRPTIAPLNAIVEHEVAPSFHAWIDAFCDVVPWPAI